MRRRGCCERARRRSSRVGARRRSRRPSPARRTDAGRRRRRCDHARRRARVAGRLDRETELDRATLSPRHSKPTYAKTLEQPGSRHHLGDESLDPGDARPGGKLLEQSRSDPRPCSGRRPRRPPRPGRPAETRVAGERDYAFLTPVGERADKRAPLGPVRVEERSDKRGSMRRKPWKRRNGSRGEPLEEREQTGCRRRRGHENATCSRRGGRRRPRRPARRGAPPSPPVRGNSPSLGGVFLSAG